MQLVRYDAMVNAIVACHSVDEVKDIRDKAMALEMYARQAQNVDAERKACEVRLRAERRTGELLRELGRADKDANLKRGPTSNDATSGKSPYASALESSGLSRQTANRYQALASVPAERFEAHLDGAVKPTTSGILRAANGSPKMDDGSLWIWGRLRDFEREGHLGQSPDDIFGGMTATMQADVRRILPTLIDWLQGLQEASE